MEHYVKELDNNKINILLINKADLLSQEVREIWTNYFKQNNTNFIFFSAKDEQEKINEDVEEDVDITYENTS